jgi:hypothetical protein
VAAHYILDENPGGLLHDRVGIRAIVRKLWEISCVTAQSDKRVRFGNGLGYGRLDSTRVRRPRLLVNICMCQDGCTKQNSHWQTRKRKTKRNMYPSAQNEEPEGP